MFLKREGLRLGVTSQQHDILHFMPRHLSWHWHLGAFSFASSWNGSRFEFRIPAAPVLFPPPVLSREHHIEYHLRTVILSIHRH